MVPAIGRSIGSGFQAANRSWAGIGLYALGSLIIGGIALGSILVTNVPEELLQPQTVEDTGAPADDDAAITQLEQQVETQQQVALDWVGRAWPLLLLALVVGVAGGLWLNAGQIGFVAQMIRTQHADAKTFVQAAGARVGALFLAWLLSIGAAIGFAIVLGLVGVVLALIGAGPAWLAVVLGIVVAIAVLAGLIWLAVRLVFWFIAIVADGAGPVAGLKRSFAATKGRWWPVFGLGLVLGLISFAVTQVFQLLVGLGNLLPGAAGITLAVAFGVVGFAINLYVGFAVLGAYLRYYEDTKAPAAGFNPATGPAPHA
ncbi:MAG TPA: hypothetical protein VGB20_02175 [bacterium]